MKSDLRKKDFVRNRFLVKIALRGSSFKGYIKIRVFAAPIVDVKELKARIIASVCTVTEGMVIYILTRTGIPLMMQTNLIFFSQ